jgi:hypothetical protein
VERAGTDGIICRQRCLAIRILEGEIGCCKAPLHLRQDLEMGGGFEELDLQQGTLSDLSSSSNSSSRNQ